MRKWKWPLFLVLITGAVVSVAYEQHYASEQYHAQSEADCIALSISPEEKHACAKEAQSRRDYAPWWNVLVAWPEGITTWAIIATGFVIAYQSYHTRRAADGALSNAEASLKQARLTEQQMALVFRRERGFLEIRGNGIEIKDGPGRTWSLLGDIQLTNSGNIPLRVFSGAGECLVLKVGDYARSIGSQKLQDIDSPNTWIRPRDGGYREGLWSDEIEQSKTVFARMLTNFEIQIILRGTIDYESHGSAWRRFYAFMWLSDKPKSGDEITKGKWVEDSDAENEEYEIPCPPQCPF